MSTAFSQPTRKATSKAALRRGLVRFSATYLLVALILLLVAAPFLERFRYGILVESVVMTLVLVSALLVVAGRKRAFVAALMLVTPALLARWFDFFNPTPLSQATKMSFAAVFVAFTVAQLWLFILHARRVTAEVVCAAISAYLLLGLLFAFAYSLLALSDPGSFALVGPAAAHRPLHPFEALYFSFTTLTTTGYGDIVPVSNVARMLAMLQATTGLFYMGVLIARLMSQYSRRSITMRGSEDTE